MTRLRVLELVLLLELDVSIEEFDINKKGCERITPPFLSRLLKNYASSFLLKYQSTYS